MCFAFLLCMLMTSANKSIEKKNWKCYKTIGSYVSCAFIKIWSTWEVWRALKKLELLSATPRATLMHLSCSPNFLHASYLVERMLMYEPIVNLWFYMKWQHMQQTKNWLVSISWFISSLAFHGNFEKFKWNRVLTELLLSFFLVYL